MREYTHLNRANFTGEEKFEIITAGGHRIILDDLDQKIILSSSDGNILIILDDQAMKISLESAGEIEVNAVGDINLNANANIDIQANGTVNVKGAVINLN